MRSRRVVVLAAALAAVLAVVAVAESGPRAADAYARAGDVVVRVARVNVATSGAQAGGPTFGATVSGNGRYVAFVSQASSLVPGDRNGTSDVFVRDLRASRTTRVSVSSGGAEGDGPSHIPSISHDGRLVAFPSSATNLVGGDRNGLQDVFVRDRTSRRTRRVSIGSDGNEANGLSLAPLLSGDGSVVVYTSEASNLVPADRNGVPDVFVTEVKGRRTSRVSVGVSGESVAGSESASVSADGRFVALRSFAPNLVVDDSNGLPDIFVRDRRTQTTERVNVSSAGAQADAASFRGMLSGDARFVGFRSWADNLVPGDGNDALDVFVHDRDTGQTSRISVGANGSEADAGRLDDASRNHFVSRPFLSASGRFAAFTSRASNLVPGDRNGLPDVFVHDLETGRTIRVSVSAGGSEANGASSVRGISADGRLVVFQSFATNLVPGDTNGRRDVFVAWLWQAPGDPLFTFVELMLGSAP